MKLNPKYKEFENQDTGLLVTFQKFIMRRNVPRKFTQSINSQIK